MRGLTFPLGLPVAAPVVLNFSKRAFDWAADAQADTRTTSFDGETGYGWEAVLSSALRRTQRVLKTFDTRFIVRDL